MKSVRTLAAVAGVSLGTLGVSCNEPRYELVAESGNAAGLALRLNRETGELCHEHFAAGYRCRVRNCRKDEGMALRSRATGAGSKPPQAALAESLGRER